MITLLGDRELIALLFRRFVACVSSGMMFFLLLVSVIYSVIVAIFGHLLYCFIERTQF